MNVHGRTGIVAAVLAAALLAAPGALAQDPPPPELPPAMAAGVDLSFTVVADDGTTLTVAAADSIDATVHALGPLTLEIALEGVNGVASTQLTVSGLPPETDLFKSDGDLRNVVVVATDEFGTLSWTQDVAEPHNVLIKPHLSTWYLDDDGWQARVFQHDHTYSAWYRLDADIPYMDSYFVLESQGSRVVSYALWDLGPKTGEVGEVITETSSGLQLSKMVFGASGSQWHNILVTYDADDPGREHRIYLDGVYARYMPSSSGLADAAGLMIGCDRTGQNCFNGWIDDVAVWDRELTADEIAAIQQQAVADIPGIDQGMVASWSFDSDFSATYGGPDYDGVPYNGPIIDTFGRFGGSARIQRAAGQGIQVGQPVLFRDVETPGTWDPVTRTAVLTGDLDEMVQIRASDLTLDGGGYVLSRPADPGIKTYGLYIYNGQNVTVRGLEISGGSYGLRSQGGSDLVIEDCFIHGATNSTLYLYSSPGSLISGCEIVGSISSVAIRNSPGSVVEDNVITGDGRGLNLNRSGTGSLVRGNDVNVDGIALYLERTTTPGSLSLIEDNTFRSRSAQAMYLWADDFEFFHNNFISDVGWASYAGKGVTTVVANRPLPDGGNHWSTWTGPDADGDGFVDLPYELGKGGLYDHYPFASPSGWARVAISGVVSSDCGGPLAGVTVELGRSPDPKIQAVTGADGGYAFPDLERGRDYSVVLHPSEDTVPLDPETGNYWFPGLATDVTADFLVGCLFDIAGTVASDCMGPLAGITVGLETGGDYLPLATGDDGGFLFADLPWQSEVELTCVLPLGFHAVDPVDGHVLLTVTQDETVDFALACVPAVGEARGMGYWKHQANVFVKGKGNAQESREDMETNFPAAIFSHFHQNALNGIEVPGVTYTGDPHAPLDLATIQATLTVNGGQCMLDRAKQHYLALLLNLASGKLRTFSVVSDDGRTASEGLQYVASLINDGLPENDELAKDLSEAMNEAQMLGAGLIPEDIAYIAYRQGSRKTPWVASLAQNAPNPFNPSTRIAFALPDDRRVLLAVYGVDGRRVRTLIDAPLPRGGHEAVWDGRDDRGVAVASGTYFYRLEAGDFTRTMKMLLLK